MLYSTAVTTRVHSNTAMCTSKRSRIVRVSTLCKMDTAEFARYLKLTLNISRYLTTSPYTWSDENQVEFSGRRSFRYLAFVVQMLLYIAYELFVIGRWIQVSYFDPDATTKQYPGDASTGHLLQCGPATSFDQSDSTLSTGNFES